MSDFLLKPSIEQYPAVYGKIDEIQDISAAMDEKYKNLWQAVKRLKDDNFFLTMSEEMTKRLEKIAGIEAKPLQETLEFRRIRVKNRFNMQPPYTSRFFAQKFDEIMGVGNWKATVNAKRSTLTVECSAEDAAYYEEIEATIQGMIPARMKFINKPTTTSVAKITGSIDTGAVVYAYILGSWNLGQKPFGEVEYKELVGENEMILTDEFLGSITAEMLQKIVKVKLNGSVEITELSTASEGTEGYVEYTINEEAIDTIEEIVLLTADNIVVTKANVYIPVSRKILAGNVIIKHKFRVQGVDV